MSTVLVRDLQIEHPEYTENVPFWRTISDLKDGAIAVSKNLPRYLPKRIDEDEDLYRLRLEKFSYTPVMSDAVSKYSSKLAEAQVHLSIPNENDSQFWEQLRDNTAAPELPKRIESHLLSELFGQLLYFAQAWVAVDTPQVPQIPRSKYEEQQLGIMPYFVVYSPMDVIYWDTEWAITRQFLYKPEPFKASSTLVRWTYWGVNENIVYETRVKTKTARDTQGNLYTTIQKVWVNNDWEPWDSDRAFLEPTQVIQHNRGVRLITHARIPTEKWVCVQVYLKQIQHLRIESAWTDAGYLSGIVQRVFTPPDPPPVDDPRIQFQQPNYQEELSKTGNPYILIGKSYTFAESEGKALGNLETQLDKIEAQIRYLVNLHFASGATSALEQSGASKTLDMSLLQDAMLYYGQQVLALYNNILRVTARVVGKPEPTATGLNNYSVDNLEDVVNQSAIIETLPSVPPTAKKIWYGKMAKLMTGTISPEGEQQIRDELDQIFSQDTKECDCKKENQDKETKPQEVLGWVQEDNQLPQEVMDYLYKGKPMGEDFDLSQLNFADKDWEYIING
jgi:hypothetical protein